MPGRPTVSEVLEDLRKGVGPNWQGILGAKDHVPAPWEWQSALNKRAGGGLLYYGPGRYVA
jgi:hypothetical protein